MPRNVPYRERYLKKKRFWVGVIMGGDSCSKGWVRIPAPYTGWTFFHINLL